MPTQRTRRIAALAQGLWLVAAVPSAARLAPAKAKRGNSAVLGRLVPQSPVPFYDAATFGAKADGKSLDSPAIDRAINAAGGAGGGTVRLGAGTYLCCSIHLKSNVSLFLDQGAVIVAAEAPAERDGKSGYDPPEPNEWYKYQDFGHSHWHNSLIWGEGLHDISIFGPGTIWGKGLSKGIDRDPPPGAGNKSISLKNCHNVLLRDVSILHGGHFAILATGVDNLTIDNLKIDTNRDGMDVDCCRNVRISNCSVNSPWDDGICLKSSYGLGYARATEEVTIANCFVTGGYEEGSLLDGTFKPISEAAHAGHTGRIKFGTESNGGFKNITITNCVFDSCQGLALETVDGGSIEDVAIDNITMRNVVSLPIFIRLGSRMRGPSGAEIGRVRRVTISNVVVYNTAARYASIISGIPGHDVEDIKISNIRVLHQGGGTRNDISIEPPERETAYPEPGMFGTMPAYGFFIRHARGITISDVQLSFEKRDLRPAFYLDDVDDAEFRNVRTPREDGVPAFVLRAVQNLDIRDFPPLQDKHVDLATRERL